MDTAPDSLLPSAGGREQLLVRILTAIFFLGIGVILCLPLTSRLSWLVFVQDDFLYYLKVAQNIAQGHGSTFNGVVSTNGYQPLWLLFLVALSWFTTNPHLILAFLAASNLLASSLTFYLARKLLTVSGARPLLVFALAAWITLYSLTLFFYCMEVTLAVPIMLGVLWLLYQWEWTTQSAFHAFIMGLLLTAMVLARIDTLIFGALLLAGILLTPTLRGEIRLALCAGAAIGLSPLGVYFLANHILFKSWLPISGAAKELKQGYLPSMEPWRVFFHPLAGLLTLVILSALALLPLITLHKKSLLRVLIFASLVFPFVYYLLLSCISDWTLWGWYMYPIRTALCMSFLVFFCYPPTRKFLEGRIMLPAFVASVFLCLSLVRWTRQQTDIYEASLDVAHFSSSHSGVYAMGDRAGRVAYLIPDPVIQTEGLMMDRTYLDYVQRQTPLREVLAHYKVRYYVATAYTPFVGCFQAAEPAKAGDHSAKMRAEFCSPAEAVFFHDGVETLIFDLER